MATDTERAADSGLARELLKVPVRPMRDGEDYYVISQSLRDRILSALTPAINKALQEKDNES